MLGSKPQKRELDLVAASAAPYSPPRPDLPCIPPSSTQVHPMSPTTGISLQYCFLQRKCYFWGKWRACKLHSSSPKRKNRQTGAGKRGGREEKNLSSAHTYTHCLSHTHTHFSGVPLAYIFVCVFEDFLCQTRRLSPSTF